MAQFEQWNGFKGKRLEVNSVDVRSFIQDNYTVYEGDEAFLAEPTEATHKIMGKASETAERRKSKKAASWIWRQKLFPD